MNTYKTPYHRVVQANPFEIIYDDSKHQYWIDDEPVPSVTQITGIVNKGGGLPWWGMQIGVAGICQLHNAGEEIPWDDPDGATKLLTAKKLTVNHVKTKAGTRGTSLHDGLEGYVSRGRIPNAIDYPAEDAGYVQALARALLELRPEPLEVEAIVGSKTFGYAGRFDLLAVIDGIVTRLDLKTGKRVYPEQQFPQLEAYEAAAVECGRQASVRRAVLRLDKDGSFEFRESCADFEHFWALHAAFTAVAEIRERVKAAVA